MNYAQVHRALTAEKNGMHMDLLGPMVASLLTWKRGGLEQKFQTMNSKKRRNRFGLNRASSFGDMSFSMCEDKIKIYRSVFEWGTFENLELLHG